MTVPADQPPLGPLVAGAQADFHPCLRAQAEADGTSWAGSRCSWPRMMWASVFLRKFCIGPHPVELTVTTLSDICSPGGASVVPSWPADRAPWKPSLFGVAYFKADGSPGVETQATTSASASWFWGASLPTG